MKKFVLLVALLVVSFYGFSQQSSKCRVAVAVYQDKEFSLFGALITRSLPLNLADLKPGYIREVLDSNVFELKVVPFPTQLIVEEKEKHDPSISTLSSWLKTLKNNEQHDIAVIIFSPLVDNSKHNFINGFSYGMNTSNKVIFSLNDALIIDLKTRKLLNRVGIRSVDDYLARAELTSFAKRPMLEYKVEDVKSQADLIVDLDKAFALKVCQQLTLAKRKLDAGR
jgi:hypothetical protein